MANDLLRRRRMMFALLGGGGGLPAEFQQVEWIESTTNGMKVTIPYIIGSEHIRIEAHYENRGYYAPYILSSYNNDTNSGIYAYSTVGDNAYYWKCGIDAYGRWYLTSDYIVEMNNGQLSVNGPIRNYNGSIISGLPIDIFGGKEQRLYNFRLYDNDILKVDLIPCYRKADGQVGVYDLVSGAFIIDATGHPFDKGANVGGTDGVYVQAYDGRLYTNEQWDRTQPAKGIALLYGNVRIVIRKSYTEAISRNMVVTGYDWDNALLVDGITATQDLVARIKQASRWGERNWQGAYDSLVAEGGVPYIPSINEVNAIYTNRTAIDQLITLIGGVAWGRAYSSIGSTQYSSQTLWVNNNGSWVVQYPDNTNRIYLIERYD